MNDRLKDGSTDRSAAPLIFIVGSTATGKSDLAIDIAESLASSSKAEIISADSVQIYRELKIGSARPPDSDLARVTHHFIAHVSVADDYTAGQFERDAHALIQSDLTRSFIVAGGSGFYVQALAKGMYPIEKADPAVIAELEARADSEGLEALYRELQTADPEAAARIASADRYRIIRALEILRQLEPGQTLTEVRAQFEQESRSRFGARPIASIGLRLSKESLERRVRTRAAKMVKEGLLDEVDALLKAGMGDRPGLQSVGYKECLAYFAGEIAQADLVSEITQATMRLAKKQRTWFQRAPETRWFDAESERREALAYADSFLNRSS